MSWIGEMRGCTEELDKEKRTVDVGLMWKG